MKIKQDPVTGLWAREDGAVLLPPVKHSVFKKFRWVFGSDPGGGYRVVWYKGKYRLVHRIICSAFHGLPPEGKPEVDHLDRCPSNNREDNLRWADRKGNNDNRGCVDQSIEKYGVRWCEDKKAYNKAYYAEHNAPKEAMTKCH